MSERWAINASPVILLSKAGLIDFLPKICDEIVIPSGVVAEVATGSEGDAGREWLAGNGSRYLVNPVSLPAQLVGAELGQGETEVLAWALAHPGFSVVLDDRQGRRWANRLQLPLIGSLGVVVLLKRKGLIAQAKPSLEMIRDISGRVSDAAIQAALAEAGES